ncbi:hypothetical protein MTO96_034268 [Rhipicephalus appendiculatus]
MKTECANARHEDTFAVDNVVRRNLALVTCAAPFLMGTRHRYCAAAAELAHWNTGLVAKVQALASVDENEAVSRIQNSLKTFFELDDFIASAIPSVFLESESQLNTLPELSVSHDLQELLQDDDVVWEEHQERLLTQLRGTNLQLAGDGRCDSPGHSAKYLTYSFLCPDSGNIIHTEQVQVKESEQVKASATMKNEGLIRRLKFLSDHGMKVKSLTTDRHPGIKKYMRLQCPGIGHYYDVWHVGKGAKKSFRNLALGGLLCFLDMYAV